MVAPLVADSTRTADATDAADILALPRLLCDLSEVEAYVLARVATHCWTGDGVIPYIPRTRHQRQVALGLARSGVRLLVASSWGGGRCEFWLTRLGALVARRVLHITPEGLERQKEREREFDRMRALAYNAWEPFS
jgi:hypothetical protein